MPPADVCLRPNPWGLGVIPGVTVPLCLLHAGNRRGPAATCATADSPAIARSLRGGRQGPANRLWLADQGIRGGPLLTPDYLQIFRDLGFITCTSSMIPVLERVYRAASDRSGSTVVLFGETGTGKEVLAQAIHKLSPRREKTLVDLNCAAFQEALLESELFGHVRGAFTGADKDKPGLLETADGGTLFLDEIGDMSPAMQVKLLRAIEGKTFRRVGGKNEIRSDFRLIAATNKDLEAEMRAGRFREDFYYRINVVPVRIPPLHNRRDDIIPLAEHFIQVALAKEGSIKTLGMDDAMKELLTRYSWPGNVRELQSVIGQVVILRANESGELRAEDLPRDILEKLEGGKGLSASEGGDPSLFDSLLSAGVNVRSLQILYLRRALEMTGGNVTRAAAMIGIVPNTAARWLKNS